MCGTVGVARGNGAQKRTLRVRDEADLANHVRYCWINPGVARVGRASGGGTVFVMAPRCGWGVLVGQGVARRGGESRGKRRVTLDSFVRYPQTAALLAS